MAQQTMYPAAANSRQTELSAAIDAVQPTITVLDISVIPAAPNQLTIGTDETAETITYTGISGSNLTGVTRGFQGTAKAWPIGTKVARYFTAYDHDAFRGNIADLDTRVNAAETPAGAQAKADAAQSAAASDATTKANAAEANAKAYSDSKQTTSIKPLEREVANLNLQLAAASRVSNGVTFGSNFADSFGMTFDLTKTSTTAALSAGATSIAVTSATGLSAGMEVTIYDDTNLERVTITSISGTTLTVPALAKAYKSSANVARTMAVLDATNRMLKFGGWTTTVTNTVTDASVVNSAYDTSGNGGRKLVRLSNGWLVAVLGNGTTNYFYKSTDNGVTWAQLCYLSWGYSAGFSMVAVGTMVYCVMTPTTATILTFVKFDATTVANLNLNTTTIDSGQISFGSGISLAVNDAGTELHAAWASKNSTYPNSFNIRYAKGTIAGDGSVTWGAVSYPAGSLNTAGQDNVSPCIACRSDGNPTLIYNQTYSGHSQIRAAKYISSWADAVIYDGLTYNQSNPSAIFVPQSINGLANGRIWVAWHGADATEQMVNNIRLSYSDDGGVTWSAMQKLTSGNTIRMESPSITVNKNNRVFIIFFNYTNGGIKQVSYDGTSWSGVVDITSNNTALYPSAIYDSSFNLDFSSPLFVYKTSQSGGRIGFYGTWKTTGTLPVTENDIRFTVKDTSEAVLWAQRDAALTVDATFNGLTMDKTTVGNEDQFVKTLGASGKAEVRLHMTRASTAADIGISRILGGVS